MRVSIIQMANRDGATREESMAHALAMLDQARGSDLVVMPELWPTGYFAFARYADESEPLDGPTLRSIRDRAASIGAFVCAGSVVERAGETLHNTSVLIDPGGRIGAVYRKIHLFGYQSQERR